MKKLFGRLLQGFERIPNGVLLALGGALFIIGVAVRLIFGGGCGFLRCFGIPCPTCGMTRAFLSLFRLDLAAAFAYNPAFPTFIAACVLLALSCADKKRRRLYVILFALDLAVLLAVWVIRLALGV